MGKKKQKFLRINFLKQPSLTSNSFFPSIVHILVANKCFNVTEKKKKKERERNIKNPEKKAEANVLIYIYKL